MHAIAIESIPQIRATRKRGPLAIPERTKKAIVRYSSAYAAVFGVPPTVLVEGDWIRIQGQSARVKVNRLKELTEQLEYRASK